MDIETPSLEDPAMTSSVATRRPAKAVLVGLTLVALLLAAAAWAAPAPKDPDQGLNLHKLWRSQEGVTTRGCLAGAIGNGNNPGPNRKDTDGDGVDDLCDAFPYDPGRSGRLHVGMLDAVDDTWQTVAIPGRYLKPVIIVGPAGYNDAEPGLIQIDSVTQYSFDIRFSEWTYQDGNHDVAESIPYIVYEAGRYHMDDGSIWEFGTRDVWNTGRFRNETFLAPFPGTPVVFVSGQSAVGQDPYTARARNVTPEGFQVTLFEEEGLMNGHGWEDVGYMAVYSPTGQGTIEVKGEEIPYLIQSATMRDLFTPMMSWNLKIAEEQSVDLETAHIKEQVVGMAIGPHLFAQDLSGLGLDTFTLRRLDPIESAEIEWGTVDGVGDSWIRVPLAKSYSNPVVVAKVASSNDMDPGAIRLRGVSSGSFEMRFEEWSYLDGPHGGERVFYMVAEAGQHDLGGLVVEAGTVISNGTVAGGEWAAIDLKAPFVGEPGVFASMQTQEATAPAVTRIEHRAPAGFRLGLQEEEGSLADGRAAETLGWIAVEMGRGETPSGRVIEVFARDIGDVAREVHLTPNDARMFRTVVADIASTRELDPANLRHEKLSRNRIQVLVHEEQSLDVEMTHVPEEVCFFVAD
jgi:hypothetical protein